MTDIKLFEMSELEQEKWCRANIKEYKWLGGESLADLAFRMKKETGTKLFYDSMYDIYETLCGKGGIKGFSVWLCSDSCKPIHWIYAAIKAATKKAKEQSNE